MNLGLILRWVHSRGPLTRSELVEVTGLNRTTVGALVSDLAEQGLVYESPASPDGAPGRPSMMVHPRAESAVVIAIDISMDSIAVAALGFGSKVLKDIRVDAARSDRSPEQVVAEIAELYRSEIKPAIPQDTLIGVGISLAGIVSSSDGIARFVPNLGWRDVPITQMISTALDVDLPIYLGNDGDLGALAEHTRGATVGVDNFVYLTGETGVGGGLIIDGGPMDGASGFVGEVGHLPINPHGSRCSCGAIGCWETEVGEKAILRRAGYPEDGGRSAVDAVLEAAENGDHQVLSALAETGHWLGIGISGLINIFNPSAIVLARLFARIYPYAAEVVVEEIDNRALAAPRADVQIVISDLGDHGSLLGAAELAFQPLLLDPQVFWSEDGSPIPGRQSVTNKKQS